MKTLRQLLALGMSFVLVLLLLEGVLRLLGFAPTATLNRFDPRVGWIKEPRASTRRHTAEFDVAYATNSRGLREPESVGYETPAGIQRVLMVGDSFTLGYTVAEDATIPALLEERLRAEGRAVEVINAGTEGWSTDQEVLWLDGEGRRYRPDVVVLQMYENDVFWNGQDHYLRYPKPRLGRGAALADMPANLVDPGRGTWLARHSALASLLAAAVAPPAMPLLPGAPGLPAEWGLRVLESAPGVAETGLALEAFAALAQEIGARPVVLIVPDKAQVDPASRAAMARLIDDRRYDPERPFATMARLANEAGLPVVDPRAALRAAGEAGTQSLYFEHDWHTTATGNEILAESLAAALAQPALLGPPPRGERRQVPVAGQPGSSAAGPASAPYPRWPVVALAVWLVLATAMWRRFPQQGALASILGVALLVGAVVAIAAVLSVLQAWLPASLGRLVPWLAGGGLAVAVLWKLRSRLPVMIALFATFVRRGQWYVLPALAGLLSIGGLLVVAAASPWLAPFIYTLF